MWGLDGVSCRADGIEIPDRWVVLEQSSSAALSRHLETQAHTHTHMYKNTYTQTKINNKEISNTLLLHAVNVLNTHTTTHTYCELTSRSCSGRSHAFWLRLQGGGCGPFTVGGASGVVGENPVLVLAEGLQGVTGINEL